MFQEQNIFLILIDHIFFFIFIFFLFLNFFYFLLFSGVISKYLFYVSEEELYLQSV